MRNSLAKKLKRKAELETVGRPATQTRKVYRQLKAVFLKMNSINKVKTLMFFNTVVQPKPATPFSPFSIKDVV